MRLNKYNLDNLVILQLKLRDKLFKEKILYKR